MKKFWDRVMALLESPSVVELARSLEVNRSTLSSWIHNDRRPPMITAMKISELTGVSLKMLEYGLDWDSQEEEEDDEVAEGISPLMKSVLQSIKALDTEQLELVQTIVDYLKTSKGKAKQS